jgi:hypothetical protein
MAIHPALHKKLQSVAVKSRLPAQYGQALETKVATNVLVEIIWAVLLSAYSNEEVVTWGFHELPHRGHRHHNLPSKSTSYRTLELDKQLSIVSLLEKTQAADSPRWTSQSSSCLTKIPFSSSGGTAIVVTVDEEDSTSASSRPIETASFGWPVEELQVSKDAIIRG